MMAKVYGGSSQRLRAMDCEEDGGPGPERVSVFSFVLHGLGADGSQERHPR